MATATDLQYQPMSDAQCETIGDRLPTRSYSDTQQTQDEIGGLYAAFSFACPDHVNLIP